MISLLLALMPQAEVEPLVQVLSAEDLEIRLYCDQKEFLVGEPIDITVIVRNCSERELILPGFDFGIPGLLESVRVANAEQPFQNAEYGVGNICRWPSLAHLPPGASQAFDFTLNDLRTSMNLIGAVRIQVSLEISARTYWAGDTFPLAVPAAMKVERPCSVASDILQIQVLEPKEPGDVAVHAWLLSRSKAEFWNCTGCVLPCFEDAFFEVRERILHFHPDSRYAIHVRNEECRGAITELKRGSADEVLTRITGFNLGPFEDNRLLEAYQAMAGAVLDRDPAELQPILDRLRDHHPNSDGFQRARARGLL